MTKYNKLTSEEIEIIENKGTEKAFSGKYIDQKEDGVYICKKCNAPLFASVDKYQSSCGWPSFDDEIKNKIIQQPDADGRRVEIICANCLGHLGHIFKGEEHTTKNTRYCVNSISLNFCAKKISKAYFAAGCFWGVENKFANLKGVISTYSGYSGGNETNPTYEQVKKGKAEHFETVEILFDQDEISYNQLLEHFFEIHDFSQQDGQGCDLGNQYLSRIFYINLQQKKLALKNIKALSSSKKVATKIIEFTKFYKAEDYHQDYIAKKNQKKT